LDISDDYEIRSYALGEEQEIVDLISLVFTEWKARGDKALDHWRWKYLENPWGPCTIAVAVRDDQIVGVAHDIYCYVKVGDAYEKTVYGTDVAVHPSSGLRTQRARKSLVSEMTERYWEDSLESLDAGYYEKI
jgi:hypothetical protein